MTKLSAMHHRPVPHKVHSAVYCTFAIGKLGILHRKYMHTVLSMVRINYTAKIVNMVVNKTT